MFRKKKTKFAIEIVREKCTGCKTCINRCRRQVFGLCNIDGVLFAMVNNPFDCTFCGQCVRRCPGNAIRYIINNESFIKNK